MRFRGTPKTHIGWAGHTIVKKIAFIRYIYMMETIIYDCLTSIRAAFVCGLILSIVAGWVSSKLEDAFPRCDLHWVRVLCVCTGLVCACMAVGE